jgi:hypothetical protein
VDQTSKIQFRARPRDCHSRIQRQKLCRNRPTSASETSSEAHMWHILFFVHQVVCFAQFLGGFYTVFDAESDYDSPVAWREIRFLLLVHLFCSFSSFCFLCEVEPLKLCPHTDADVLDRQHNPQNACSSETTQPKTASQSSIRTRKYDIPTLKALRQDRAAGS